MTNFSGRKKLEEGNGDFPVAKYAGAEKTEKAQAYAEWLIEEKEIRPVLIDSRTIFYQFNRDNMTWEEIDFELIKKKANRDMGSEYTSHFLRQFKQSFQDHWKFMKFKEMGLDEDEVLLKNGEVLNLKTREIREAEKEDMALNHINAEYNPEAEPERIEDFIDRTIDTEEGVKAVQEYLGYCLMWPSSKFEKVLLILGYTDTGKSTLLKVFEAFFNGSNITKMSFPQIGMERAFHVEKLKDSVVNFDFDMDDSEIPRKSRLKKVISNEEIHADPKGEKGYDFRPQTKFMIASNNAPDDSDATDAYYNRFKTIQATNQIDSEDKERDLVEKLTTEENMSWLLNWALEGLERLEKQNKFSKDMTEYETKKAWDKFGSSVQRFISDQIRRKTDDAINVPTTDLYDVYEMWCDTKLESPVSQQKFIAQAATHPDLVKKKAMTRNGSRKSCFVDIEVKDYAI